MTHHFDTELDGLKQKLLAMAGHAEAAVNQAVTALLERNRELYLEVPSIREYWIVDPRADADRPSMTVLRRRGQRWQRPIAVPAGGVYSTRLLPGFTLHLGPQP